LELGIGKEEQVEKWTPRGSEGAAINEHENQC